MKITLFLSALILTAQLSAATGICKKVDANGTLTTISAGSFYNCNNASNWDTKSTFYWLQKDADLIVLQTIVNGAVTGSQVTVRQDASRRYISPSK